MNGRELDLPGDRRDRGHGFRCLGGHRVRHHPAIRHAGDVDAAPIDGGVLRDVGDHRLQERDVVDVLRHRQPAARTRVEAVLRVLRDRVRVELRGDPRAVGIRHQVPVAVRGRVHPGLDLLELAVLRRAVEVQHQGQRTAGRGGRWDVQAVAAGQPTGPQGEDVRVRTRSDGGRRDRGGGGRRRGRRPGRAAPRTQSDHQRGERDDADPTMRAPAHTNIPRHRSPRRIAVGAAKPNLCRCPAARSRMTRRGGSPACSTRSTRCSFADSNADGVGDLRGIIERTRPPRSGSASTRIWLSPITVSPNADWGYDVADYCAVRARARDAGRLRRADRGRARAGDPGPARLRPEPHQRSAPVVRGLPVVDDRRRMRDWYVWADPKPDGSPPNNWVSSFGGPAWTLDPRDRPVLPAQPPAASSPTSTGGTTTCATSSTPSCGSGSTAGSTGSASTCAT